MQDTKPIGFFTATILNWKPLLLSDARKEIIISSLKFLVDENRVKVCGFVLMPNHIHLLWQIQPGHERENVQRDFLKYTGQKLKFNLIDSNDKMLQEFDVSAKDRRYQIWERNSLSKMIFSIDMLLQKLEYIHNNPVQGKWMLSDSPQNYTYSSASFYDSGVDRFGFLTNFRDIVG